MIPMVAMLYAAMCGGIILFQFALIFGAPWGAATQGGGHKGALPTTGRVIAAISVPIQVLLAMAILSAGGDVGWNWPIWTAYAALTLQLLISILNRITRSRIERLIWAPITLFMSALALLVIFA